ncbi:MAG TPA: hypothetical protein VKD72_07065 [Gemmataceae bacterium]|nr:hypothetical protein [Gemmataceae bacterium]
MRLAPLLRLIVLLLLAFTAGCLSENKGKIEGTRWRSEAGTVQRKGNALSGPSSIRVPEGYMELDFHKDGSLYYIVRGKIYTGKYTLGAGRAVTLHLDEAVAGLKTHTETVVIQGNRLTMTDTDGTELSFIKQP